MIGGLTMIEKLTELATDLGLDIIRSNISDTHNLRMIKNEIFEFVKDRQELNSIYNDYDIDYEGYLRYIRSEMIDEIKRYICTIDYEEAKNIKQIVLDKASSFEGQRGYCTGTIQFITENCINIIKEYYKGKLDGNYKLLAHITVQTIVDSIIPKINIIDGKVERIKDTLDEQEENRKADDLMIYNELRNIHDMIRKSGKTNEETYIRSFHLAYCEQDTSGVELRDWFDYNSIKYDICCYSDDPTQNEDVICRLDMNQALIVLIGEAFLRNIHCVYGLAEMIKNQSSSDRILPLIIDRSIFSIESRIQRIGYWETKETELRNTIDKLEKVQHAHNLISEELVKYERTAQSIDELIMWISNNSYTLETIKEIVKKKILS